MFYLLGRVIYYAGLGLLAIVIIGPVVGIVGAMIPFAVIGLAAYGLTRAVRRVYRRRRAENVTVQPVVIEPARISAQDANVPNREPGAGVRRGRVVLEILCGGLVGGLVAGAITWQTPDLAGTVIPAVAAGAVVGYLVGGTSSTSGGACCSREVC